MTWQNIAIITIIFITTLSLNIIQKKSKLKINLLKILSIILAVVFAVRYLYGKEYLQKIVVSLDSMAETTLEQKIQVILIWLGLVVNLILILYQYLKTNTLNNIVKLFCLPSTVILIALWNTYTKGIVGENNDIRLILLSIELGINLSYCLIVNIQNKLDFSKKNTIYDTILILIIVLLSTMPVYTLRTLFTRMNTSVEVKELTSIHREILYMSIIIPIVLYVLLKGKDENIIRFVIIFIALGTLITYSANSRFERFLNPTNWPLHLCNTAMYIIPLCLLLKLDKLFYFTYFINVLGAFLAMAMPNYDAALNPFAPGLILFYVNHYCAFFMPLLIVELGIFKRPKLKQFLYSMVAFAVYFVFILIINAWFTNYNENVDFFFLNSSFVADKLGSWAIRLRDFTVEFNIKDLKFVFYPVYQVLYFLVYALLGLGMWFLYDIMYQISDRFVDIKILNKKLSLESTELKQKLGKDITLPVNKDSINKLVIKDFKKKYEMANFYSVKGINLEVNSGEIFGFMGPNGAGKSTTIKCLVGTQGISDGKIFVNGYDVETQPIQAKMQLGFVPDHYALYEKMTGREYVNYIADIYKVKKYERNKLIDKYVKLFQLEESFDSPIRTYSHGMKQKIAIMSAVIHNPKIWVLDEPLTGLDPDSIYQVKECMKEHAKNGNIVFFSSHLVELIEKLCDRIAVIRKGEIVAIDSVKNILEKESLEDFYLRNVGNTDENGGK